jgi:hypothetical protein
MNSGSHRGFTVVTIITLIFAPIFLHHHWVYTLASITSQTHTEKCVAHQPCPSSKTIVNVVVIPLPKDPPRGGGNHEDEYKAHDTHSQYGQYGPQDQYDHYDNGKRSLVAALAP